MVGRERHASNQAVYRPELERWSRIIRESKVERDESRAMRREKLRLVEIDSLFFDTSVEGAPLTITRAQL